jgi:hypothetical protein
MRFFTLTTFLVLMTVGCAPRIDYVGRSLPPTRNVDLFLDPAEVTRPYELIGKASGQAGDMTRFAEIQERILREARKRGADAVVLTGWDREVVGVTSNSVTNSSGNAVHQTIGDSSALRTRTLGWNAQAVTNASQANQVMKIMQADFIRYR